MANQITVIAVAAASAAASFPLVRYAAWRTVKQPLPHDLGAEAAALDHLETHPEQIAHSRLDAESFTHPDSRTRWGNLPQRVDTGTGHVENPSVKRVADLAEERRLYPGAVPVQRFDEHPYLFRPKPAVTAKRTLSTAAFTAVGGALVAHLCTDPVQMAAALILLFGAVVVALVDVDTLFLDLPTWLVSVAAASTGAIWFNRGPDDRSWILLAAVAAVAWVLALELLNGIYRVLRGATGLGFGDTMIAAGTAFVATNLSRRYEMTLWGVLAGMALALAVSAALMLFRRRGSREPFALGPYLAGGWPLAWVLATQIGGL